MNQRRLLWLTAGFGFVSVLVGIGLISAALLFTDGWFFGLPKVAIVYLCGSAVVVIGLYLVTLSYAKLVGLENKEGDSGRDVRK